MSNDGRSTLWMIKFPKMRYFGLGVEQAFVYYIKSGILRESAAAHSENSAPHRMKVVV